MTNLEGRVLRRKRALPPPPEVRTDLEVLAELADRLGRGRYFSADPRTVFDELRRASAGGIADYAGITYERIEAEQGVFWPCPAEDHPGTPRLFADGFPTPDGRARFIRVEHRDPAEMPDREFPYVLTTGRIMQQYQSGNQTRRVRALHRGAARAARRAAPRPGPPARHRGRRPGRAAHPPRPRGVPGPAHRPASGRTPSSPRSTGSARNAADQPGARPALQDARVQGVRGRHRPRSEGTTQVQSTPGSCRASSVRGQGPRPAGPLDGALATSCRTGVAQAVYFRGGNAATSWSASC